MTSMLRGLFLSAALTTTLALVGCGGTIEDNHSSQQCESSHQCTNGVCECTTEHFLCASWRAPELYALDKETGKLAWKTELEDRVGAKTPPVVVYVLDLSGNPYVFESEG